MSTVRRRRAGCGTCIRRKVKCDETQPICERCKKGNFVCEGYAPKIVFVDESQAAGVAPASSQGAAAAQGLLAVSDQEHERGKRRNSPSPSPSQDFEAWQANVAVAYTMEHLFKQNQEGLFHGDNPVRSWLELAVDQTKPEINMDSAIGALCMAYFGKRHHQLNLVTQSKYRYGRALRALNECLSDPETAKSLTTLRDTMALVVYEVVVFSDPHNWMRHADGMGELFMLRGPDTFRDPLSLHIFLSCRVIIILQCLIERKYCFLADPAWQQVTAFFEAQHPSPLTAVIDLLCFVPGILGKVELFHKSGLGGEDRAVKYREILGEINALISSLFRWRYHWQASNPWAASRVPVDPNTASPLSPFKTVIHFDSLENANCLDIYNSTLITLLELGQAFRGRDNFSLAPALEDARSQCLSILPPQGSGDNKNDSDSVLLPPSDDLTAEGLALELCAAADYHFEPAHRGMGAFVLIWPLKLSEHVLEAQPLFSRWIGAMLDRIADEDALELVRAPLLAFLFP